MRKSLIAFVAACVMVASVLAPTKAEARWGWGWGWGLGGLAAGLFIGAALASPYYGSYPYYGSGYYPYYRRHYYRPYYHYGYGYYRPYHGWRVARRVAIHRYRWH